MRTFSAALLLSCLITGPVTTQAQIAFGGHPRGVGRTISLPEAPLSVMPSVDREAMLAEDAARNAQGVKGPYRFGFNHHVDLGLDNSGVWHTLTNGDRVWRLAIQCPEAFSINFEFHDYVIPEGAQVFVYNDMQEVLGGFEAGSNPGETVLGVTQLAGDRITIEYVEPLAVRGQGQLRVGQVTHAYRDIMGITKGLNDSGACNNNVICPVGDPWRNQIRSVAMITVGGQGICTGTLINNCQENGTPYFLTARHCTQGENLNTWVFRFNWQSSNCNTTTNGPTTQTVSGATMRHNSAPTDVALIQLNTTPPAGYNVFYSGWDKSATPATSATAIHHPSGDVKKISFENQPVTAATFQGVTAWRVAAWDDGTTEGGSSGSGLWNQNGLLVGQLYGGYADCGFNVNDYYGRLNVSFPNLTTWLGTCGDSIGGYPITTSIDEKAVKAQLNVAPNPTTGALNITLPTGLTGNVSVRILDALGRTVEQSNVPVNTGRLSFDLAAQRDGAYVVEVTANNRRLVERVILSR